MEGAAVHLHALTTSGCQGYTSSPFVYSSRTVNTQGSSLARALSSMDGTVHQGDSLEAHRDIRSALLLSNNVATQHAMRYTMSVARRIPSNEAIVGSNEHASLETLDTHIETTEEPGIGAHHQTQRRGLFRRIFRRFAGNTEQEVDGPQNRRRGMVSRLWSRISLLTSRRSDETGNAGEATVHRDAQEPRHEQSPSVRAVNLRSVGYGAPDPHMITGTAPEFVLPSREITQSRKIKLLQRDLVHIRKHYRGIPVHAGSPPWIAQSDPNTVRGPQRF